MKNIFIILKLVVLLLGSVCVFFSAILYLGSDIQLKEALKNDFWNSVLSRFTFSLVVAIIFFLISLLLNFIFRNKHVIAKKRIRQVAVAEMSYYLLLAVGMTVFFFCSNN